MLGVPLTHSNIVTNLGNISRHYRLTPEDRSLIVMPLFHVHGLIGYSGLSFKAPLFVLLRESSRVQLLAVDPLQRWLSCHSA